VVKTKLFLTSLISTLLFFNLFATSSSAYIDPTDPLIGTTSTSTSTSSEPLTPVITPSNLPCGDLDKNNVYPPNGECYSTPKKIESQVEKYPLTCIPPPVVIYSEKVNAMSPPPPTIIPVPVQTNVSDATLGFLGPDVGTYGSINPDQVAQKYLFNALLDRPAYSNDEIPRESFRTFWRMLNSRTQANIKALYLSNTDSNTTKVSYYYLDENSKTKETDTKKLYSNLPNCLRKSPVCEDYYAKYKELDSDLKAQYDTLLPFDFNSLRSYIVLNDTITKENVPYLSALIRGLKGDLGLLNFYTTSWMIRKIDNLPTTTNELTLSTALINAAASVSCPSLEPSTNLNSPRTYPENPLLPQIVRVPVVSEFVESTPGYYNCSFYGCIYYPGENIYEIKGTAVGKTLAVFNNPYARILDNFIANGDPKENPPFFKMLLPDFVPIPTKALVNAPISDTISQNGNATIGNPNQPIYRESNLAQDSMAQLQNCWLVPQSQQTSPICPKDKTASCGDFTDVVVSDPDCGICNIEKIPGLIDDPMSSAFPEGVPDLFLKILQKAGESYNVPAAFIFGTMYNEGAFSGGRYQYTDANIREWSKCGGKMPNCDDTQTSVAQTPFGWIPYWFYAGEGTNGLWSAIRAIDPTREKNNTSPCNFADGVFATAKALKMWTSARSPDFEKYFKATGDNTCCQGGACYTLDNTSPSSCSQWTNDDAAQSRVGYAGYCPEPGKHSIESYFVDNAPFITRAITRFNALKCF